MPTTSVRRLSSSASNSSRRRMSIMVRMRPRTLRTPAISGGASGTEVKRSGTNTSCTPAIGSPKSWPPIVAVTYSTYCSIRLRPRDGACARCFVLERGDEAAAIEFGDVIAHADTLAALEGLRGDAGAQTDDGRLRRARIATQCGCQIKTIHSRHI